MQRKQKNRMKTKILLALICLGATLSQAQETHLDIKVSDTVESDLFGSVKSIQTVYKKETFRSSGASKHTTKEKKFTYDEKGNLRLFVSKNIEKETTERIEYTYGTNGCLSGKIIESSENETNKTFTFSIDVKSRQLLRRNLDTGDLRIEVYSPVGYEHYIEERDSSNTVTKIVQVKRLANNKECEFTTFDGKKNRTRTSQIKWNTHGLMREFHTRSHGTNEYIFITKYTHPKKDEAGNWIKRIAKTEMIHDGEKKRFSEEIAVSEIEYFEE